MIDKDKFAKRIKILARGRSAKAVAEKIGCDPKTIRNALAGKIPGVEILDKLVAGETTVGWLLGETDITDTTHIAATNEQKTDRSSAVVPFQRRTDIDGLCEVVEWVANQGDDRAELGIAVKVMVQQHFPDFTEWLKKRGGGNNQDGLSAAQLSVNGD